MSEGSELLTYWFLTVVFSLAFTLSYHVYVSLKKRFDEEYGDISLLPKRLVHGAVYMIFLVLLHEAVRLRVSSNSEGVEAVLLLFLIAIGIPIFLDITITLHKFFKKR